MTTLAVRGVLGSVAITLSGLIDARVPRGSWPVTAPVLGSLRRGDHQLLVGLSLAFVGLVLVTSAWWDLRGDAVGRPDGLSLVRRCTALWAAPMLVAPPLFSGDGWSYVGTGYLARHGLSPYKFTAEAMPYELRTSVSPHWRHAVSPYGPLPIAWGDLAAHVTSSPWLLLAAYRFLSVLSLAVIAWAVPVLARRTGRDPVRASALVIASPFVLVHGIGGLHNDLLVVALMLAALVAAGPDRWLAGAALAGCAAAVKAPGGLVAVGVVLLSLAPGATLPARVRRTIPISVVAGVTLWFCGWITGQGSGWVGGLSVPGHAHTPLAVTTDLGLVLRDVAERLGVASSAMVGVDDPLALCRHLGVVALLLLVGWALLRHRLVDSETALAMVGAVLLVAALLSPAVHPWYALWAIPILACVRLSVPAAAALVGGIGILGITALEDGALPFVWLKVASTLAVLLGPPLIWYAASRLGARADTAKPEAVGAD